MVSFLHTANQIDDWLIEAVENVLPALHPIYCQILRTADPSRVAKGTRTNLTPLVKQNRTALSALGSILEYVINFCDVDTEEVAKHLKNFILSSTAVLLASDIQSPKDIVCTNPCMYAVDETLRKASWTLSNILLTLPRLVPVAETIIMKRIDSFFKLVQDPYELSVQRSAIIALKALYEHGSVNKNRPEASTRDVINRKIISVLGACLESHSAFQRMRLNDDMFKDVNWILNRFSGKFDINERGVTTNDCSVQVKCLKEKSRRRVPFRVASVDWNLNSMMVRYEDESTIHWPFFAVQNFEWRRKNQDLWIKFEGWESCKATDVVIRFKVKTANVSTKSSIEQRIRHVMLLVEPDSDYDTEENVPTSEDSDIVETQNVRTTNKKLSRASFERGESVDRNKQEGNFEECYSAHVNEIQHGDSERNAAVGQNVNAVPPKVTADGQAEVVWTDLFTSGQTSRPLTNEDNPSKDFSKKKRSEDTKHRGGRDALSKIGNASGSATANREYSDTNLIDAEAEDYARIVEGTEKSAGTQERKSKVKFAPNPDEIEVIIISDDDSMEPMDPANVEFDVEGRVIKEENIAENIKVDQKNLDSHKRRDTDSKTKVNFSKQSRFKRKGKNDQHAEQRDQRRDKSGRNKPPDGIVSDDDFMKQKDCSEESSDDEDSSDNDYIPGDVKLMADEDFEKADHTAIQTRRQLRDQVMLQNENKHTRAGAWKNRECSYIEKELDHEDEGTDKSFEEIRECFTEYADGEDCQNVELGVSDDDVKSNELNSNLVDDDEFENGHLDELGTVEEEEIDAVAEGKDKSRAHEGYIRGTDRIIEIPDETRERRGDDSGSIGEDVENSPNMDTTKELGEIAEDANCRKDVDKRDRNCNGSNKCAGEAAVIINYSEVKDQFGSLVENLNEVSLLYKFH